MATYPPSDQATCGTEDDDWEAWSDAGGSASAAPPVQQQPPPARQLQPAGIALINTKAPEHVKGRGKYIAWLAEQFERASPGRKEIRVQETLVIKFRNWPTPRDPWIENIINYYWDEHC